MDQDQLNALAGTLDVTVEVLDNRADEHGTDGRALGAGGGRCARVAVHLTNGGVDLSAGATGDAGWTLHFGCLHRILAVETGGFTHRHLTGDNHTLRVESDALPWPSGETRTVVLVWEDRTPSRADILPRWFLVAEGLAPAVVASTEVDDADPAAPSFAAPISAENLVLSAEDRTVVATPATRFASDARRSRNGSWEPCESDIAVVPRPREVTSTGVVIDLPHGLNFAEGEGRGWLDVVRAAASRQGVTVGPEGLAVQFEIDPGLPHEAYTLRVTPDAAVICAAGEAGHRYGSVTLLALVSPDGTRLPEVAIADAPRFRHRGFMADIARNFVGPECLLRLLDAMAAVKLNVLHLHLSEDEAWRLEIPGLPELTEIGGHRGYTVDEGDVLLPQLGAGPNGGTSGSGFLTRSDYVQIVRAAALRGITVVPEIDVPGHSRAAVVSMEARYHRLRAAGETESVAAEFRLVDPDDTSRLLTVQRYDRKSLVNPAVPGVMKFVRHVMAAVRDMHAEAGVPLRHWHFGGDEAMNRLLWPGYDQAAVGPQDKPWAASPAALRLVDEGRIRSVDDLAEVIASDIADVAAEMGMEGLMAWQDGVETFKDAASLHVPVTAFVWVPLSDGGIEKLAELGSHGFGLVAAIPDFLYFDHPHEVHGDERGAAWATRYIDEFRAFSMPPENLAQAAETVVDRLGRSMQIVTPEEPPALIGIEAALWTETVRGPVQFEQMAFPRLFSAAERAWHRASWELDPEPGRVFGPGSESVAVGELEADWARFAEVVGTRLLPMLDSLGIGYRVPPPGAIREGDSVTVSTAFPGLDVQVSSDGGDSWATVPVGQPFLASEPVRVRCISTGRDRTSRTEVI